MNPVYFFAMDFFRVHTLWFGALYYFFVITRERRRILNRHATHNQFLDHATAVRFGIRKLPRQIHSSGVHLGLRVFLCSNMAFSGDFTPVLAKHTKSFNLIDTLSVGVDRIQRNFEPLERQVETWRKTQITDETAKLIFYSAFVDGNLEAHFPAV